MEKSAQFNKENCVVGRYRSLYIWFKTRANNEDKSIIKVPGLVQKLKTKSEKAYVFPCSLNSADIPPATAKWRAAANDDLPKINNKMFTQYVSMKREGSAGQQEKALQMFTSRKIVNVKSLVNEQVVYVNTMVKKSYGFM